MAPSSGGSRYDRDMRRRLAAMMAALLHEDGSLDPRAAVRNRRRCQVWGCDQAHLPSEWVQVDHEFQCQLREVLWGSGTEPGLMAILACERAQHQQMRGMAQNGFRLGMPVSMWWFAGLPFGVSLWELRSDDESDQARTQFSLRNRRSGHWHPSKPQTYVCEKQGCCSVLQTMVRPLAPLSGLVTPTVWLGCGRLCGPCVSTITT